MPELALIDVIVLGVAVGFAYAVATQVLIPVFLGQRLFPVLRTRRQLERELAEARDRLAQARLERELEDLKREVDAARMPPEIFDIVHGGRDRRKGDVQ